jgi:hypothetical protein
VTAATGRDPVHVVEADAGSLAEVPGLLEAAADRIEALAADATPGPWRACEDHGVDFTGEGWSAITVHAAERRVARIHDTGVGDGDDVLANAAWIALASPAIAPHLAAWLREVAWQTRRILDLQTDEPSRVRTTEAHFANPGVVAAAGLARLVLPGWTSGVAAGSEGEA